MDWLCHHFMIGWVSRGRTSTNQSNDIAKRKKHHFIRWEKQFKAAQKDYLLK